MAETPHPPFMNAYGNIPNILRKLQNAQTPQRFTYDFLKGLLGYRSGGAEAIIPLMKRIGFLGTDGTPTELYKRFRNPAESGRAMAEAIKKGYEAIYALNEKAHTLSRENLDGLITQITGLQKDSSTVRSIAKTFEALKGFANFEAASEQQQEALAKPPATTPPLPQESHPPPARDTQEVGMNISYTINLNLPETDNVAVFNAIFSALKAHLLRK